MGEGTLHANSPLTEMTGRFCAITDDEIGYFAQSYSKHIERRSPGKSLGTLPLDGDDVRA